MSSDFTPGQRVRAAIQGELVDRVPFCFWHHFQPQGSGARLAALTKEFFVEKFQLDIVKIMPDLHYPEPPEPITEAEQMGSLPRLSLDTPMFREQLICIRDLRTQIGKDYPLILTLFSPLTYAFRFLLQYPKTGQKKEDVSNIPRPATQRDSLYQRKPKLSIDFAPGKQRAIMEARKDPASFEEGLRIIATNLRQLMAAAIDEGADGIFFSCMGATSADLTINEYKRFGQCYDIEALSGAQQGWLNIVHIHADPMQNNDQIYFDLFADYPWTAALSWSDRLTGPPLSEALTITEKCLMGGLWERGPLMHGSETEIENEIMAAVTQTKGRKLILANGCSIPDETPEKWLHMARRLVDQPR